MIAIIRIAGDTQLRETIKETFYRMRIRRKYACVVWEKPTNEQMGMLKKVADLVAYGEIDKDTYEELIKKRGKKVNGKLKEFFRLHPPRGGIDSKEHYGQHKGVLGNNKNGINALIRRML